MIYFWIFLGGIIVFKLSLFINHKRVEKALPDEIGATKRPKECVDTQTT